MSTLFGGARSRATQPNIPAPETALRLTTSVQGKPRPIGWGRARVGANLIWLNDFQPYLVANYTPPQVNQAGGKGGGARSQQQGTITYTWNYLCRAIFSLAEGLIDDVVAVNSGNTWYTWAGAPNLTGKVKPNQFGAGTIGGPLTYATLFRGSQTQTPYGPLASLHPDQSLAYRGEAYVVTDPIVLGTSTSIPQMSFDIIFGKLCGLLNFPFEAYAGDVIFDYLTNPEYGIPGYTTDLVEAPTEYNLFCGANSLLVSPVLTDQVEASSFITDLLQATHSAIFMSGGKLRLRPYAEADASDNGLTYTHDATPIYDLEPQDFLPGANGADPIEINRKQPQEIVNNLRLEFFDRDNSYGPVIIETRDEASIAAYGIERQSDVRAHHFFCRAECASASAALQLQREQVTTTYTFSLPREFELLDPMDLLTLPLDKMGQGQPRQPVRIIEIVENDDYTFAITAEEYLGTADMPIYSRQATTHNVPDFNADPGDINDPILFELPTIISRGLNIYAAISGQNPDVWGGAEVWVSYDSVNYIFAERILSNARMGVLASELPITTATAGPVGTGGFHYDEEAQIATTFGTTVAQTGAGQINLLAQLGVLPRINAAATEQMSAAATIAAHHSIFLDQPPRNYSDFVGLGVVMSLVADVTGTTRVSSDTAGLNAVMRIAAASRTADAVTLNPADKAPAIGLSPGNLVATNSTGGADANVRSTSSGNVGDKFAVTFSTVNTSASNGAGIGLMTSAASLSDYPGSDRSVSVGWFVDGYVQGPSGINGHFAPSYGAGDVVELKILTSTIQCIKNGSVVFTFPDKPVGALFAAIDLRNSGDTCSVDFSNWAGAATDSIDAAVAFGISPRIAPLGSGGTEQVTISLTPQIAAINTSTAHPTLNPADKATAIRLSGGNLTATDTIGGGAANARSTFPLSTGDAFNAVFSAIGTSGHTVGIGLITTAASLNSYVGSDPTVGVGWFSDGYVQGPGVAAYIAPTFNVGDEVGMKLLASTIECYKNGALVFTFSTIPAGSLYAAIDLFDAGDAVTCDFTDVSFSGGTGPATYDASAILNVTATIFAAASGGGAITWDPSGTNSAISLSSDHLSASYPTGGSDVIARATAALATGKQFAVTFSQLQTAPANGAGIGLITSAGSLSTFLGSDRTVSVGWFQDGYVQGPSGINGHFSVAFGPGDVVGMKLLASTIQCIKNGTVVFTFPDLPAGSPLFPAINLRNIGDNGTADFSGMA